MKILNEEIRIVKGLYVDDKTFVDKFGNKIPLVKTDLYSLADENSDEDIDKTFNANDIDDDLNDDDITSWFDKHDLDRNFKSNSNNSQQSKRFILQDDSLGKRFIYNDGDLIEIKC